MMSGLNGLTGQHVLWSVVEGTSIGHAYVRGKQRSVKVHHICLAVAIHISAKVCIMFHG